MRTSRFWITFGFCLFAVTIFAWAQGRKAGLWEITSTMTWQQSPFPQGMNLPPGAAANSPFGGGPHTTDVCVTQAQIDKFGGVPPQTQRDCQVSNIQLSPTGMSAVITCSGHFAGTGTVSTTFVDATHSTTKVHFTGSMQMGPNSRPIEWTVAASSVYKGSDCGFVKPVEIPTGN